MQDSNTQISSTSSALTEDQRPRTTPSRMTLTVHLLRADGTKTVLREPREVDEASHLDLTRGPTYPSCRCAHCTALKTSPR
jgi:hypothetical protein